MKKFFSEIFVFLSLPQYVPALLNLMFAWTYHANVATYCYRPGKVFKLFDFSTMKENMDMCICQSSRRFRNFLDKNTCSNGTNTGHVRTMDLNIVQHKGLRHALKMGLNHIPLRPTTLHDAIQVVFDAFLQVCQVLDIEHLVDMELAGKEVRTRCRLRLLEASKQNRFGFKYSQSFLFDDKTVNNELNWLIEHVYISGLDKASNNACFICVDHIRKQALERLNSPDFLPCFNNGRWSSVEEVTLSITNAIREIIPELQIDSNELPYIMAIYKFHKQKYRWISNAFGSLYVNLASLVTVTTMSLLEEVRQWANTTLTGYSNFLKANTSLYWVIDSINDFCLNLPHEVHNIYVADITRCFETIPVNGQDTLFEAMEFITSLGVKNFKSKHPRSELNVWFRTNPSGVTTKAVWASTCPKYGNWSQMSVTRFLALHQWLTTNCYVRLGNRVWKQVLGIPMGFSCSPLWCNLYLMAYEIRFIQRLAALGRTDIMNQFAYAFRYIDDLCWINVGDAHKFLDPTQPKTLSNPYWIYPLHILDIKQEVSKFSRLNPSHGVKAHFMNVLVNVSDEISGTFTIQKFDKRRDLPFAYTQYIKFLSNRPVKQAYNVTVSQTVPILYLSSSTELALHEINMLISTLTGNGFRKDRLLQIVIQTLTRTNYPAVRFKVTDLINMLQGNPPYLYIPALFSYDLYRRDITQYNVTGYRY